MAGEIVWGEAADARARWRSEAGLPPPGRVVLADDTMNADTAYRLACEGTALLWQGDYQNARQLLGALMRRIEKPPARKARGGKATPEAATAPTALFHRHRMAQAQRARILGQILVPLRGDYVVPLRRAPEVFLACLEVLGPVGDANELSVLSLRELQALIGAHEWRKKGVTISALGITIHPYYGVFSPVRGEYLELIAQAPLPAALERDSCAFDVGTGTGVIAALLARRGVATVVATDQDERALACAADNLKRLGLDDRVQVRSVNLFPEGKAPLVVCNPPWVPAKPSSPIEFAVFDPDSRMLRGFLSGLRDHLSPGGEGWLILSDLAEHLGLRPRESLMQWIEGAGLRVVGRIDTRPRHGKVNDSDDPLHTARAAEVTSLWRLTTV